VLEGVFFAFSSFFLLHEFVNIDMLSCRLVRYLYPTDEELRTLAGIPKDKSKGKKSGRNIENGKITETFHIARNLDIKVCM
jgi:hypothetical protein